MATSRASWWVFAQGSAGSWQWHRAWWLQPSARVLPYCLPAAADAPARTRTPPPQNATSAFGAFLDPVADKLMVATVLVLLCTAPPPPGIGAGLPWALPVLTCREWGAG